MGQETGDKRQKTGDRRTCFFLSFVVSQDRNKAIHDHIYKQSFTIPVPTIPAIRPHAKNASFKDFSSINPSIVGMFSFLIIFVDENSKANSLASACAREFTSPPVRAAARVQRETRRRSRRTRLPSPSPFRCIARQQEGTSPCASASPADHGRTGRTGGRRRRRIGGGRGDRRRGAAVRGWRQAGLLAGLARSRSVMFAANKGYVPSIPRRSTY